MNKQNFKLSLFVGDTSESLSIAALTKDSTAFLLDQNNIERFLKGRLEQNTTVYTSLGDLPKNLNAFVKLCLMSDEIFYRPPITWSDGKILNEFEPELSMQGITEHLLIQVSTLVSVDGLNIETGVIPMPLVDSRKSNQPQLWIAGCSISHGVGVSPKQRYGSILSNNLNIECSFLTRPGAAIDWASDQIIRSDIKRGDIVVFGVTNAQRLTYVHNQMLVTGVNALTYKLRPDFNKVVPEHNLVTDNTFYQHTVAIERAINFCSKVGANLMLVGLLSHLSPNLLRFLYTKTNFIQYPYKIDAIQTVCFSDLGTDSTHPGPVQHQQYADFIFKQLNDQI